MSRLRRVLVALIFLAGCLVAGAPLAAQDQPAQTSGPVLNIDPARIGDPSAEAPAPIDGIAGILATGKAITDTSDPRCRPENRRSGEIVVCAPSEEERNRERYPGGGDVAQGKDTHDGLVHAPNVSGLPGCEHGCIGLGGQPYVPLLINLDAIPETPKGSDAEKVASGEVRNK